MGGVGGGQQRDGKRAEPRQASLALSTEQQIVQAGTGDACAELPKQVQGLSSAKAQLKECRSRWNELLRRERDVHASERALRKREDALLQYERSLRSLEAEALARRDERNATIESIREREYALSEREQRSQEAWYALHNAARNLTSNMSSPEDLRRLKPPDAAVYAGSLPPLHNASLDQLHRTAALLSRRETELEQWALNLEVFAARLDSAQLQSQSKPQASLREQQSARPQDVSPQPKSQQSQAVGSGQQHGRHPQKQQQQGSQYQRRVTPQQAQALKEEEERKEAEERARYGLPHSARK